MLHFIKDSQKLIPKYPVTRFAPSPTGYLHLGHVISMIFVFGIASLTGAKVLLRIEDHDRQRYRKEYEQAIYDDMAWLGFIPHNWDDLTLKTSSSFRQSDCLDLYQDALDKLNSKGLIYHCECSRKQLVEGDGLELFYPGTCRNKQHLVDGIYGIRMKVGEETINFQDLARGIIVQNPSKQCGDFLLKDQRGYFTYNFAVVVDDIRQQVNLIIRGEDILHCTARQIALAKNLGQPKPSLYFHHSLAMDAHGKKLSKRTFAEGIIYRRLAGEIAEATIGEALYLAGILSKKIHVKSDEIPKIFQNLQLI